MATTSASSKMAEGKVFNDPIHGHLELHPLLIKIIDTPQFQRLRFIKQLGGGYFVYPGASHNRFEHSIGVAHLAGELARALRTRQPELEITDEDILCVQIAGLCHDLGHGPFSHLYDGMFIKEMEEKKKKKEAEGQCGGERGQVAAAGEETGGKDSEKWTHEKASIKMFHYLVKDKGLGEEMKKWNLKSTDLENETLSKDVVFIKEMIDGPLDTKAAQDKWSYKGRGKEKSFLYEIVSNKRNGIDVDKFDYFARDCHHLGMKNNFDYRRFIHFARVCEVDGKKQICVRDKEASNIYDMFHTRYYLHKRAYQHKVNKIIETMITDAFVKADRHIKIEGSGEEYTISTAMKDMKAYTKLTDRVFEQILFSSSDDLKEAREIVERIISRDLYMFLGQKLIKTPNKPDEMPEEEWEDEAKTNTKMQVKAVEEAWKAGLAELNEGLQYEDFEISEITLDYGNGHKNPVDNMRFYRKEDPKKAFKLPKEEVSQLLPKKIF